MRVSPVNSYRYAAPVMRKAVQNPPIEESTGSIGFKGKLAEKFFSDTVVGGLMAFFVRVWTEEKSEIPEEIERTLTPIDYSTCAFY